ncbi:MAG TPA: hypothetical protein VEC96_07240, partial [Anaerolineae bacterium]|nr:hypothetical protein [Anaerolineae bacterium]
MGQPNLAARLMTIGQAQPDKPAANPYRRPWWLIVNKSARLITTVQEETRPGERVFIIRGEPLVQGLGWLIWGPVGALVVILLLAGLAIAFGISERGWGIKAIFVGAFLALPALVWAGIAVVLAHLSEKFLRAERQAEAQERIICLSQNQGELYYQSLAQTEPEKLAYQHIRQARVTHPIGGRDSRALQLILETHNGPVILLNESLGT